MPLETPPNPGLATLTATIAAAQTGQVISFPTDTVPALGVQPEQSAQVFALKGRSLAKPLILMVSRLGDILPWVDAPDRPTWDQWQQMADRHWPGALTLVLPVGAKGQALAQCLNPQTPTTLGFRVPNHALALDLLQATGPLATTSANRSGEPALEDLRAIAQAFPTVTVLDPGPSPPGSGLPSTVAQWTPSGWQVLRQGSVTLSP